MIIFLVIVIIVVIFIVIWIKAGKPYVHKNICIEQLPDYFKTLLYRGFESGFMIINSNNKKKFLQFSKHIIKKNEVILEMGFPLVEWTKPYYDKLHKTLKKEKIDYLVIPKSNDDELEFTDINCRDDISFCQRLVEIIFTKVFDYKKEDLFFNITFENVSAEDVKIGFE